MYPERWNYHYRSGLVWEHIDLRSDYDEEIHKGRPNPLEDVRVRQVLAHGANRQLLADAIFDGKVRVAHSYLPDVHYAYHKSLKTYDYNPDKARKLLDAAGWKMGANGIRKRMGRPSNFDLAPRRRTRFGNWSNRFCSKTGSRSGLKSRSTMSHRVHSLVKPLTSENSLTWRCTHGCSPPSPLAILFIEGTKSRRRVIIGRAELRWASQ